MLAKPKLRSESSFQVWCWLSNEHLVWSICIVDSDERQWIHFEAISNKRTLLFFLVCVTRQVIICHIGYDEEHMQWSQPPFRGWSAIQTGFRRSLSVCAWIAFHCFLMNDDNDFQLWIILILNFVYVCSMESDHKNSNIFSVSSVKLAFVIDFMNYYKTNKTVLFFSSKKMLNIVQDVLQSKVRFMVHFL